MWVALLTDVAGSARPSRAGIGASKVNAGKYRRSFSAACLVMPRTSQRARRRGGRTSVHRERPSSIVRHKNEIAEAPPSRRQRVGLIVGRSADRRRWLGAPLARGDLAQVRSTLVNTADLSMPPVW